MTTLQFKILVLSLGTPEQEKIMSCQDLAYWENVLFLILYLFFLSLLLRLWLLTKCPLDQ